MNQVDQSFQNEIEGYIHTGKEGHWDFKENPHENKAALLHDIICMSNNLHNGDSYIILGVRDGGILKGLSKGQPFRKNQADLITFLRDKFFAGQNRPQISLTSLEINGFEIDVITIHHSPQKPFYITRDYTDKGKTVRANYIYTRIEDSNTPIDSSADIIHIEKMWQERFGINQPPLVRFQMLLSKSKDWFSDIGNKKYIFHRQFPEFQIKLGKWKISQKTYSFFFTNERSFEGQLKYKYYSGLVFKWSYIYVDEMNIFLQKPEIGDFEFSNQEKHYFYYYDLSTLQGAFLTFLKNSQVKNHYWRVGDFEPFLIFNNTEDISKFKEKIQYSKDQFEEIEIDIDYIKSTMMENQYSSFIKPESIKRCYIFWSKYFKKVIDW